MEAAWLLEGSGDSDGDGLPDGWELLYGTQVDVPDADADPDHDGRSKLEEYRAGTDPLNAASRLDAPRFSASRSLEWPSVPGHHYQLEHSEDLRHWDTLKNLTATGEETTVTLDSATPDEGFFRLRTNR